MRVCRRGEFKAEKQRESENGLQFIADKGMKNIRREKQMNKDKVMYALALWYSFI